MEPTPDPVHLLREIETRHEIVEMLTVGLRVDTIMEMLRYQASVLVLCEAVNPHISDDDDFHPLIALMELAERLKRTPSGPSLNAFVDSSQVDDLDRCEQLADTIIEQLRTATIDTSDLSGFDPHDPLGVDFSFTNALAVRTDQALLVLPSPLIVAEIGKIVVPALTKLSARVADDLDDNPGI